MDRKADRLIVITGCDSGIGRSLVKILVKKGYSLYLISENLVKATILARLPNFVLDKAIKKVYKMNYGKKIGR